MDLPTSPYSRSRQRTTFIGIVLLVFSNLCLLSFISTSGSYTLNSAYEPQPTPRIFVEKSTLDDLSPAGDAAWNNLTFASGGFILVRSNNANGDDSEADSEPWGVSMFHGLHCLQMLRAALVAKTEAPTHEGHLHAEKREDHSKHMETGHLSHCLAYLADAITCQGDSTLEPEVTKTLASGKSISAVDGMGLMHQCRDTTWLSREMQTSDQGVLREPWKWWPGQRLEDVIGMQG